MSDNWAQVLVTLIGALVTMVSTIAGILVVWLNLKAKIAENTKLTQQANQQAAQTHTEVVQTKSAMAETKAAAVAAKAYAQAANSKAADSSRITGEELKKVQDELKRLREINGGGGSE